MNRRDKRGPVCTDRDCQCRCHWHTKGAEHCHPNQHCRDVRCSCMDPQPPTPPIRDLFPTVSVARGGIQWGPTENEPRRWDRSIAEAFDVPEWMLRDVTPPITVPWDILGIKKERKRMYEVRVVIEEEGRPLVDVSIDTTSPREGINAAAVAADAAMRAHPDGPAEPQGESPSEPESPRADAIRKMQEARGGFMGGFMRGGRGVFDDPILTNGPQVSHQPGGSRF